MNKLKDSLDEMESDDAKKLKYLDVCCLLTAVSPYNKETTVFYMTLLAHAVIQKRKEMLQLLLDRGASTYYT